MNRWSKHLVRLALLLSIAPIVNANEESIDYRQHIMKTLSEQVQALAMVAQKKGPAENFTRHTEALAVTSKQALKAFEPKAVGGNAKPGVWEEWKEFSERMKQLTANLEQLDKLAKTGGMAAAAPKIPELLTCKGCHDTYRIPPPAKVKAAAPDAVQYRQLMMHSIDAQSAALGQILSGEIADDTLSSHLDVLALVAASSLKAFEPKVPGGEAKPEVWSQWADFSKKMDHFSQTTARASKLAKENGSDAALPSIVEALSCKGCHDTYRAQK